MRWIIWASVAVPYLLAFFQRLALNGAGDSVRATFHWNAAQLGMVAGAYFVAASVVRIPSGLIADRCKIRFYRSNPTGDIVAKTVFQFGCW